MLGPAAPRSAAGAAGSNTHTAGTEQLEPCVHGSTCICSSVTYVHSIGVTYTYMHRMHGYAYAPCTYAPHASAHAPHTPMHAQHFSGLSCIPSAPLSARSLQGWHRAPRGCPTAAGGSPHGASSSASIEQRCTAGSCCSQRAPAAHTHRYLPARRCQVAAHPAAPEQSKPESAPTLHHYAPLHSCGRGTITTKCDVPSPADTAPTVPT